MTSTDWRLCGTKAEPRVINPANGKIWEVYPYQVNDFNTDYWRYRGYKGGNIATQYGPEGPSLDDVHIDITNRCNMACKHCYANCGPTSKEMMSIEDFKLLCKNAAACGAARIAISGGEAILHPQYWELPAIVKENGLVLTAIFSNGKEGVNAVSGSDFQRFKAPHWTQLIFSHNPSLGQDISKVAVDLAMGEAIHNMVTVSTITASGKDIWGIYERMKHIATLRERYKDHGRFRWRVGAVRPIGRGERLDVDLIGIKTVYHKIFNDYMMNWKLWQKKFDLQIGFAFRSEFLTNEIDLYKDDDTCCRYKQNSVCVKWNGSVTPCTMDQTSYGHMSNLRDAWVAVNKGGFRAVQSKSIAECRDCRLRKYCNGGCRLCAKDGGCDPISKMTYEFFEEILPRVEKARLE